MRAAVVVMVGMLVLSGCSGKKSSLLLERNARGPIQHALSVGQKLDWRLEPTQQMLSKSGVDVTVTVATKTFLKDFFANRLYFGSYAGKNPSFPEHLVFYVTIANRSDERVEIDPSKFVLVDDLGDQYATLSIDYITALAEYHAPVSTTTRGILSEARPGYMGIGVPVGNFMASKPQGRLAQIKQGSLSSGVLHQGVVHDGLVSFWSPASGAKKLKLVIGKVKTDFNANDEPQSPLEFPFEFPASH